MIGKETEKDLNAKILQLTMNIKEKHPELYKFIEEMPLPQFKEENPDITLSNLYAYYQHLNALLNKYLLEHPGLE